MQRKPAATPAFLLDKAPRQTPPSSRRRPGPIPTVADDPAKCFRMRLTSSAAMGTDAMGPRLRRTMWRETCASPQQLSGAAQNHAQTSVLLDHALSPRRLQIPAALIRRIGRVERPDGDAVVHALVAEIG